MTEYLVSRLETYRVTYRVPAGSIEEAINELEHWSHGNAVPGIQEVKRSFAEMDDPRDWEEEDGGTP